MCAPPASIRPSTIPAPLPHFEEIAAALTGRAWCAFENWLPREVALALASETRTLEASGHLKQSAVGRGQTRLREPELRGDRTCWLEPPGATAAQQQVFSLLAELRLFLSRSLFLPLRSLEAHYALYPPGAGYTRHLDRPAGTSERQVTFVFYLNEQWHEGDGGTLRIFEEGSETCIAAEVPPRLGTVAFFLSGSIWHEVTRARRERLSLTGWMRSD